MASQVKGVGSAPYDASIPQEGLINHKLPEDVFKKILSFLDASSTGAVRQVCKQWRVVSLKFSRECELLQMRHFPKFLKSHLGQEYPTQVEKISQICNPTQILGSDLVGLKESSPSLASSISEVLQDVNDDAIIGLFQKLPEIESNFPILLALVHGVSSEEKKEGLILGIFEMFIDSNSDSYEDARGIIQELFVSKESAERFQLFAEKARQYAREGAFLKALQIANVLSEDIEMISNKEECFSFIFKKINKKFGPQLVPVFAHYIMNSSIKERIEESAEILESNSSDSEDYSMEDYSSDGSMSSLEEN